MYSPGRGRCRGLDRFRRYSPVRVDAAERPSSCGASPNGRLMQERDSGCGSLSSSVRRITVRRFLRLLLNNHSQVSALGDTLPHRGAGHICACGDLVEECSFWQAVSAGLDASRFANLPRLLPILPWPLGRRQAEGEVSFVSLEAAEPQRRGGACCRETCRRWCDRRLASTARRWSRISQPSVARSITSCSTCMAPRCLSIEQRTGAERLYSRRQLQPSADVHIVHLVRDPRGFTSSCRAHVARAPSRVRLAVGRSSSPDRIAARSGAILPSAVRGSLLRPGQAELRRLFHFLRLSSESVVLRPHVSPKNIISSGNNMLRLFDGRIELDTRWQAELSLSEQRAVLDCAGDFAERMGYREMQYEPR